ncbi:D-alanyl-D-alanine carboxypeptidase DacA [Candidatus Entotheonellaceae bacterium PAL068K]
MKPWRQRVSIWVVWLLCTGMAILPLRATAQSATPAHSPIHPILQPRDIAVNAKSAVLMAADSKQILVKQQEDEKIPPASFAKILTLYVIFDMIQRGKLSLDDEVLISKKAWRTGGSRMFIEVNSKVPLQELIKGVAVVSGNDACVALAEHAYGSTDVFVKVMNQTAERIGMYNSHFNSPHGLPRKRQYTTAYDMAILAQSYVTHFPDTLQLHSMPEYTYGGINQNNRNGLLRQDPSVDGLKTGYTAESGYHLLVTAKRENRRLIAVVMGATKRTVREKEARKLLNYGYQSFEQLSFFTKNQVVAEIPVWKGALDMVSLVTTASGVMTVPTEHKANLHQETIVPSQTVAPIKRNQVMGRALIKLNADVIKTVPLVAQNEINKAGLFKSFSHTIYLLSKQNTRALIILILVLAAAATGYILLSRRNRRRRRVGLRF